MQRPEQRHEPDPFLDWMAEFVCRGGDGTIVLAPTDGKVLTPKEAQRLAHRIEALALVELFATDPRARGGERTMIFETWLRAPRGSCWHLAITEPDRPNGWTTVVCGRPFDVGKDGVRTRTTAPSRARQCNQCREGRGKALTRATGGEQGEGRT